jgi:4-hydroxy-tetrahydrodipicolinate reductase
MIRIGILGSAGRMGKALVEVSSRDTSTQVSALVDASDSLASVLCDVDVFIDFSTPQATAKNLPILAEKGIPVVVGTTGLNTSDLAILEAASQKTPIVFATNYSVGVNVMWKVIESVTSALAADYDADIVESHHRHKKDAPSGTAVTTAQILLAAKGLDYEKNVVFGRSGRENTRSRDELGVLAVRGGGVVGEHTVIYASDGDKLEIKHTAFSRETFAAGAIRAAKWLVGRPAGLYNMQNVLGLSQGT